MTNKSAETAICQHCPDGHASPTTRPWAVFVASECDGDGQPTHLYVAPTAGQHVAESDAEWARKLLNLDQFRDDIARAIHDGPNAQEQYRRAGIPVHPWSSCPYRDQYHADADAVLDLFKEV